MNQDDSRKLELSVRFLGDLYGVVNHEDVFLIMAELQAQKVNKDNGDYGRSRAIAEINKSANEAIHARERKIEGLEATIRDLRAKLTELYHGPIVIRPSQEVPESDMSSRCGQALQRGILMAMAEDLAYEAGKMGIRTQ